MRIILFLLVACSLASCVKHDVDLVFNQLPEERMLERNKELRTKLVESANGWKAFLRTSAAGSGYGFYMKFEANEEVKMYSDWNATTAVTPKTSTYRIAYVMNTQLTFDTYNYISILQDPQTSVNGGTQSYGLQSDIEFEYIRSNADTIILRGVKYNNNLYLVKASAAEAAKYDNKGYAAAINSFNNYFLTRSNNYVTVNYNGAEIKLGIFFNTNGKTVSVQGKLPDNSFASDARGYGYSIDGAYFTDAISVLGIRFISIKLKDDGKMVLIDDKGKEYPMLQNPTPLADMVDLFGSTKTYNSIMIVGNTAPGGVTSEFTAEYNGLISRFAATSRNIDTVEFRLSNSNTALVRIWYLSGTSRFLADASFNYTYSNGIITLSNYTPSVSNTNWTTRITQIGSFLTCLQSGPFKADWVSSTTPGSPTLGGLYKTSKPTDFLYGEMKKR